MKQQINKLCMLCDFRHNTNGTVLHNAFE